MSRGLKIGDVYQDQQEEARRAAIIVAVDADGTRARLQYLDGKGDFAATQDQLVSWIIIGSLAYRDDPEPWHIAKLGSDGRYLWETYAPDEYHARLIARQTTDVAGGHVEIRKA